MKRLMLMLLLAPVPAFAQARVRLQRDTVIDGVACGATGRGYAELHASGRLLTCPLARDSTIGGNRLSAQTWITLNEAGRLRRAWLARDTPLSGRPCKGTGYKGYSVEFHESGSLALCFLARDAMIDSVPCMHGSFWTEVMGRGSSAATFSADGRLRGCQLARDVVLNGQRRKKWERFSAELPRG
jgi:hypothetical protein